MQPSTKLGLAATLVLICTSTMAEDEHSGRAPVATEASTQHKQHDHAQAQAGSPGAAVGQGKWQGREWTNYPLLTPMMDRNGDRATAKFAAQNIRPAKLEVFAPGGPADRLHRQFPASAEGTRIEAVTPKIGNYHWVSAREESASKVTVASTAYFFGNPGEAPTRLLLEQKNELEIIPQPLPREHGAWRESEKWPFLLRFNGQPLAKKVVRMETEFGTKTSFISDEKGMVTVLFPRDFKPAEEKPGEGGHDHGPRRAKFVLAVVHDDGGKRFLTAFNYTYSADAARGKNLSAGIGFGLLGMLLATPLLRRRKANNHNGAKEA
ncbi:MAG: hypothetical protein PHZ14_00600 [Sulfuricella sp.]|nr:hypothetical protein [Sulfuricella sp.]